MTRRLATWTLATVCVACGGGDDPAADAGVTAADAAVTTGCPRTPAPETRARKVVVSHPFGESGAQTNTYEVLDLDTAGVLSGPGPAFEMGRASDGRIVFTPDGEIGVVAQNDGTLGIFSLAGAAPQVIDAGYDADVAFYATGVVMAADGSAVYVLNGQWRENGGGVYVVELDCDGTPTYAGRVAESRLPKAMALLGGARALVAADDIAGSAAGHTAHLFDLAGGTAVSGVDAFGDDDLIISDAALTAAGDYLLVGDNNQFYETQGLVNRVAIVGVTGDALSALGVLSPIEDPFAIVASPYDDGAIVVSGFGDAIYELDFDADADPPFSNAGELTYSGGGPQLPGAAVMLERGDLAGLVLVSENQGVRRVRFTGGGTVEDLGLTSWATGVPAIVGAIGVQP